MTFEEWMGEAIGYTIREEWIAADFDTALENDVENYQRFRNWLKAAFEAGQESK